MGISNITYPNIPQLEAFFTEAKKQLLLNENNIIAMQYPKTLQNEPDISWEKWDSQAENIKEINSEILKSISHKAGVYAIFSRNSSNENWQVKYIGQTTKQFSKQRLTNHLITKHRNTGAKLAKVKLSIASGKQVGFSFLQIEPAELRHFVEEKLIKSQEILEWNQRSKK